MSWEPIRPKQAGGSTPTISVAKSGLHIGKHTMDAIRREGYNFLAVSVDREQKALRFNASKDPNDFAWPANDDAATLSSPNDVAREFGYLPARYRARIDREGDAVYAVLAPDAEKWPLLRAAVVEAES